MHSHLLRAGGQTRAQHSPYVIRALQVDHRPGASRQQESWHRHRDAELAQQHDKETDVVSKVTCTPTTVPERLLHDRLRCHGPCFPAVTVGSAAEVGQ